MSDGEGPGRVARGLRPVGPGAPSGPARGAAHDHCRRESSRRPSTCRCRSRSPTGPAAHCRGRRRDWILACPAGQPLPSDGVSHGSVFQAATGWAAWWSFRSSGTRPEISSRAQRCTARPAGGDGGSPRCHWVPRGRAVGTRQRHGQHLGQRLVRPRREPERAVTPMAGDSSARLSSRTICAPAEVRLVGERPPGKASAAGALPATVPARSRRRPLPRHPGRRWRPQRELPVVR
jgi:hypothetical protein